MQGQTSAAYEKKYKTWSKIIHFYFLRLLVIFRQISKNELMSTLKLENVHVPNSVSIADTYVMNNGLPSAHICDKNPKSLIKKVKEELDRRGAQISSAMRSKYFQDDINCLLTKQRSQIENWCDQIPVLGYNSGRYDLN